jgi:hypothetical protein
MFPSSFPSSTAHLLQTHFPADKAAELEICAENINGEQLNETLIEDGATDAMTACDTNPFRPGYDHAAGNRAATDSAANTDASAFIDVAEMRYQNTLRMCAKY